MSAMSVGVFHAALAAEDHRQEDSVALALDAESRIPLAVTQDEREYWVRMADYWWGRS